MMSKRLKTALMAAAVGSNAALLATSALLLFAPAPPAIALDLMRVSILSGAVGAIGCELLQEFHPRRLWRSRRKQHRVADPLEFEIFTRWRRALVDGNTEVQVELESLIKAGAIDDE